VLSLKFGQRICALQHWGDDGWLAGLSITGQMKVSTLQEGFLKEFGLTLAHLAGAMGSPVWVLLSKVPYWPYLLEGEETPWYPSAKLFRNLERDNWSNVEEEVKSALSMLVETR
jgi:hypothetical protein